MNGLNFEPMYDILITVAKKDINKLKFLYESIGQNLTGFDLINVVSDEQIPREQRINGISYWLDKEAVDFDFSLFKGNIALRKGWYVQQFVKLFQWITENDYLVIDSDVYLNKKISIFENGKPCFLLGKDQYHQPYFDFNNQMLGFSREYPYSFINEIMYFKRDLIFEMLNEIDPEYVHLLGMNVG
jgi:hypothetical protein